MFDTTTKKYLTGHLELSKSYLHSLSYEIVKLSQNLEKLFFYECIEPAVVGKVTLVHMCRRLHNPETAGRLSLHTTSS